MQNLQVSDGQRLQYITRNGLVFESTAGFWDLKVDVFMMGMMLRNCDRVKNRGEPVLKVRIPHKCLLVFKQWTL